MDTPAPPPVLKVEQLCKRYGALNAVEPVSFEVAPGEIVGLVGPNGAGKTTTINMVLGVLAPTAGRIEIEGDRPARPAQPGAGPHQLRRGLCAAARQPDGRAEPARVRHDLRGAGPVGADRGAAARVRPRRASAGPRRACCRRASRRGWPRQGDAEPPAPAAARRADRLDRPLHRPRHPRRHRRPSPQAAQCGVLWTSHNMYEVEAVCDRVLFLSRGKILLEGDPKTLPRRARRRQPGRPVRRRGARGAARRSACGPARRSRAMNPTRVGAIVLRQLYLYARQPAAGAAAVRLGGDRHPAVGLHHPLSQQRLARGFNFTWGRSSSLPPSVGPFTFCGTPASTRRHFL